MFNVLVTANSTSWETDQLMRMDAGRFKEYSGSEAEAVSLEKPASLAILERVPALLIYELGVQEANAEIVRFGYVRDLTTRDGSLVFEFDERGYFERSVIQEYADRLDIGRWELNRTHWAVKDGAMPSDMLGKMTPLAFGTHISEVTRRGLIDALLLRDKTFHGNMKRLDFLKRIWNLASMPSSDPRYDSAEADIWQHTINNDDWDDSYLLYDYLRLGSCKDGIFLRFVELTVHPLVGDQQEISSRVAAINTMLRADGFRLVQTKEVSGRPLFTAKQIGADGKSDAPAYEVVLSFAGEDRDYVEAVAAFLQGQGVDVFYDRYEEATLWGKDLAEHLDLVYRSSARYCVMFISEHYAKKIWPNHERRSALARAIAERHEYILPARFDDTEVPGIRPTLGHVSLIGKPPEELGRLVLKKLGRFSA
jgi:hypothetical protein